MIFNIIPSDSSKYYKDSTADYGGFDNVNNFDDSMVFECIPFKEYLKRVNVSDRAVLQFSGYFNKYIRVKDIHGNYKLFRRCIITNK